VISLASSAAFCRTFRLRVVVIARQPARQIVGRMQELISPYLDGELGLEASLEVERHLQDCRICSHEYENHQALRSALRNEDLYFKPSARFAERVQSAVRKESKSRTNTPRFSWRWLSIAGATAVLLIAGTLAVRLISTRSANDAMTQEVIASHIRSLMASHLTDVPSGDQHTVKPWFNGKLAFSPPVKDMASEGYPLIGGRLDYLNNQPVAAVVYQRRQHFINVFVWPLTLEREDDHGESSRQGYNLIHWTQAGMSYWAVSDLNRAELQQFVALLKEQ
jgi:anti-sigma factor RsiW